MNLRKIFTQANRRDLGLAVFQLALFVFLTMNARYGDGVTVRSSVAMVIVVSIAAILYYSTIETNETPHPYWLLASFFIPLIVAVINDIWASLPSFPGSSSEFRFWLFAIFAQSSFLLLAAIASRVPYKETQL